MSRQYNNPWIPDEAVGILNAEKGSILDVGGGAAPYFKASHILDFSHYDADRLKDNAWGGSLADGKVWRSEQYTQFDLCGGIDWPFEDNQFDLGLCSHTLEELRDPLSVFNELLRVCKSILVICPSRLLEQTMGIDHPRYCGFAHHIWMVDWEDETLVFRPKSPAVNLAGCHLVCPMGKILQVKYGSMCFYGSDVKAEIRMSYDAAADHREYRDFLHPFLSKGDLFVSDGYKHGLKYWVWKYRQKHLGWF